MNSPLEIDDDRQKKQLLSLSPGHPDYRIKEFKFETS